MPKVIHVKSARNPIPEAGIAVGESYYWWKFKNCQRSVSKTPPKPSQLTRSEFWQFVYGLQENNSGAPSFDGIEGDIDTIKGELEDHKSELEEKLSNMPDGLQQGSTGELIQERIDALDDCISELEAIDISGDFEDEEDEEVAKEQRAEEIWSEVEDALGNISCG